MSRPRKEDVKVPVRRRIAQALWEAMAEMPYEDIRVMELAKRAGINHNMIYYYYKSVREMAMDALTTELADRRLQDALYDLLTGADTDAAASLAQRRRSKEDAPKTPAEKLQIAQLYAAADADGLRKALEDEILNGWLSKIGLKKDQLTAEEQLSLSFLLGGLADLLAAPDAKKTPAVLLAAAEGPVQEAFGSVLKALAARPDCAPEEAPAPAAEEEVKAPARKTAVKTEAKKPAAKKTEDAAPAKMPAAKTAAKKPAAAAEAKKQTPAKKPAASAAAKKAAEEKKRKEAERLEAARLEAERLEAERLEAERKEAERLEAERLEAERKEAERLAAEQEDSRDMEVWML